MTYPHLYRQRWESFLAQQQIQSTNVQLSALTTRFRADLAMARAIQQALLPTSAPNWTGIDIAAISRPAQEVGGDFYTYHTLGADHMIVAVGDVSGKGLPAALLMATSLAALDAQFGQHSAPSIILTRLSQALQPYTRTTQQNCALCCAELRDGQVQVANAGGIPPLLRRRDGTTHWIEAGGFPLGIALGASLGYAEVSCPLELGDTLVLLSDGLVEARNASGELFGFDRTAAALQAAPVGAAHDLLRYMLDAMEQFLHGAEPHDDLTIVVVQFSSS